ncbi:MAG TPA: lipoprotein [Arenimonas sp.]|nr:lipoprotein [Arenimonas sp.]
MNKISTKFLISLMALSLLVVACGNKGPLVKPEEKPAEAEAKQ